MRISPNSLKEKSGVGFGTSGIRAKVEELTNFIIWAYTKAFIKFLKQKNDLSLGKIAIAGDLRGSTKDIMEIVAMAIKDSGLEVVNCGYIPTPAVVYYGSVKKIPSIMVTGSHIPADRNGIKYHLSNREIIKEDEKVISEIKITIDENLFNNKGMLLNGKHDDLPKAVDEARDLYIKRYLNFFPKQMLAGKKLGLYGHSAVGREIIEEVLKLLGAEVIRLGFSDSFISVDTEVVGEKLAAKGKEWNKKYGLEAIVSTDGDGDRPLIADEKGNWLRSDILGILTAGYLKADAIVTPVSCNTALERSGIVKKIVRVKIGSPYVLAEMLKLTDKGYRAVMGYEANGGFLIESQVNLDGRVLAGLQTRDALIVLLSLLSLSAEKKKELSALVAELPQRFTFSSSVKDFPTELSLKILEDLETGTFEEQKKKVEKVLGVGLARVKEINNLDGLRITLENGEIIHFRPSRNSPEFRDYTEADSPERAKQLSDIANKIIVGWLN